jgi:hypothetical protein
VLDQQGTDEPMVVDAALVSTSNVTASNGTGAVWLRVPISAKHVHSSETTELDGIEPVSVEINVYAYERNGTPEISYLAAGSAPTKAYTALHNATSVSNVWTKIADVALSGGVATVSAQVESSNFRLAKLHKAELYENT